jgi:hypothetical protein
MVEGWTSLNAEECREQYESDPALVAEFHRTDGGQPVVQLYEDGTFEVDGEGTVPVDLCFYVLAEWHNWLKAKGI